MDREEDFSTIISGMPQLAASIFRKGYQWPRPGGPSSVFPIDLRFTGKHLEAAGYLTSAATQGRRRAPLCLEELEPEVFTPENSGASGERAGDNPMAIQVYLTTVSIWAGTLEVPSAPSTTTG